MVYSFLRDKILIHDAAHNSAGQLRKGYQEVSDPSKTPGARHPIVFTDPNTNKKALFIGRRPHAYIVGLNIVESEKLKAPFFSKEKATPADIDNDNIINSENGEETKIG